MNVPEELIYTNEHEWIAETDGSSRRIGITDYAQDQLGDIVFVELPEVGIEVDAGTVLVEVESTKSVGEVYAPFPGTVVAVNEAVTNAPELVNGDPFGEGWLVEIEPAGTIEGDFLDPAAYRALID